MKDFRASLIFTAIGLGFAAWWGSTHHMGWATALFLCSVLAVMEISLSFDNAVVNAGVLRDMNEFWRKMFLTVGILIAVFGMRLVLPVVIVALAADMGLWETASLAVSDAKAYGEKLRGCHAVIASFGGMFLLLVFLNFIFDHEREIHWLGALEHRLGRLGKMDNLAILVAMICLLAVTWTMPENAQASVLVAGLVGIALYVFMDGLGSALGGDEGGQTATRSGIAGFLYLEVLDASFSLDGVVGAFAMTSDIVLIMIGLAIGAFFVRSITISLVRRGTLSEYIYLEHGAHYAIGALAACMLASIHIHDIPEWITGLIGAIFIGLAFWSSLRKNRSEAPT